MRTQTPRLDGPHTQGVSTRTSDARPIVLRLLDWFADRNCAYRQAQKLKNMPDERLADMGISRNRANTAFYRQHRVSDANHKKIVLQRMW